MQSPHTDDEGSSDEGKSLTAPTADAPTASTYYGDIFQSSSSGEDSPKSGSSSDDLSDNDSPCPETSGLGDNPTHIQEQIRNSEPTVVSEEEDASNLLLIQSFHMQGVPINGDMDDISSVSHTRDDVPYGSTTDNSEDDAVPDNSEDDAVPDMQMHENTRTSSAQILDISNIEVNMHSDEDAPLPAPTADTLTTSVCYGDLLNSFSSSDDASSDVLSDNPTRRPPIVPQVEVDASHLTLNPSFHSQGDPINGDMAGPSLNPFIGDEFHDGSTTDNFEDVGVPDSSEDVAVPDKDLCSSSDDSSSEGSTSDVAVPDNSEAVAAAVPGIQMHENRQTSSSQISNTSNFQPPRRRRTAPAYFDDPESIGARVAKRSRASTAPIELAKPLDVTNYIKEVSARLLTERVSQQAFLQFSIASNRAVQKAIASSKRALGEAPK